MVKSRIELYYLLWIVVSVTGQGHKYNDHMGRADKQKILWLCDDLVKDAMLKLRQIIQIRTEHEKYIAFNIGMIIGKIREKYRNMLDVYRDMIDKTNNRMEMFPSGMRTRQPIHYIISMERMHYIQVDIDKLVDVLDQTATVVLKNEDLLIGREGLRPSGRAGNEREGIEEIAREQNAKSLVRQKYLMKKLGKPTNITTTMKRFINQWPVEETWSLDGYSLKGSM